MAGFSKVSGLTGATQAVPFREAGDPSTVRLLPGQSLFEPITLERGVTTDPGFQQWGDQVWNFSAGQGLQTSLADFRRDLTLERYNAAGQRVMAYDIYNGWPSEYVALPELDDDANVFAIQTLVLQNEGWERRADVVPPAPSPY